MQKRPNNKYESAVSPGNDCIGGKKIIHDANGLALNVSSQGHKSYFVSSFREMLVSLVFLIHSGRWRDQKLHGKANKLEIEVTEMVVTRGK